MLLSILIFLIIKNRINQGIGDYKPLIEATIQGSNFMFLFSITSLVYALKAGFQIFWVSSYNIKIS